jgi:hypothetical protein
LRHVTGRRIDVRARRYYARSTLTGYFDDSSQRALHLLSSAPQCHSHQH